MKVRAFLAAAVLVAAAVIVPAGPASANPHSHPISDTYSAVGVKCYFQMTHTINLYGYPLGITDAYGSNCLQSGTKSKLWVSGWPWNPIAGNQGNPSVATGPQGWSPWWSNHKVCAVDYWGQWDCETIGYPH